MIYILRILFNLFKVGVNIEDHIPCLKYFDYDAGYDFLQNTIFIIDKRHKNTDITQLLSHKSAKLKFEKYLVYEISFKFISIKLDQKVQFKYLDILDFKIVQKENEIAAKILQLRNLIENPELLMDKSKYIASFVDTKSVIETKYCAESKYFNDTKSLFDIKNDSFEDNRYQNDSKQLQQLQIVSEKKISFYFDSQHQQSSPPQLTSKASKSQRFETTQREQSPRYFSTQNQNIDFRFDDMQPQSPKITDDQMNDLNILTTRDIKSGRLMLEPTLQDQQSNRYQSQKTQTQTQTQYYKKSKQVSKTESNFHKDEIQQVVSNKDTSLNSRSSTYTNRIPKKIKSKRMSCNLTYFSMIGFLSLFQLIIVNWVVYTISEEGITRFQQQFKIISNPMSMYMRSLDILRQISFYYFIDSDSTIEKEQKKVEQSITKEYQKYILNGFKQDFFELIETKNNLTLLQFLSQIKLETKDYTKIDRRTSAQNLQSTDLFKTLRDYLTSSYNMQIFVDNNKEKFLWENISIFKQKIFIFQDYMKDDMFKVLENCQDNNFLTLIIVVISSISLMVVILVVIYVQQMQKKKILSLLGCFTPEILADQSDRLEELVFQYKQRYIFNNRRRKTLFYDTNNIHKNFLNARKENYIDCKKDFINRLKEHPINNFNQNNRNNDNNTNDVNDKNTNVASEYQANEDGYNDLNEYNIYDQNPYQIENNKDGENDEIQYNYIKSTDMIDPKKSKVFERKQTNLTRKELQSSKTRKVSYAKSVTKSQKKSNSEYENQGSNKRKRIQAHFDTFRALRYHHFILGLIIICILNCKSFVNIILFEPYTVEQKWLIEEKLKVYDLEATVVQNAAPQYLNLEYFWGGVTFYETVYYKFINSQKEENQQKLLLVKTLANPASFTLHDENQYKDFYMEMLIGDICKARQKYPQYVRSNFTADQCNLLYDGILTKGLLFSINKAYTDVNAIMDIYNIDGYKFSSYSEIVKKFTINKINGHTTAELNNLLKFVNESIQAVSFYYHNISDSYTLFIMQIILVQILVITIWLCVNKKLKNDMNQAKLYFTLFNINILATNSPLNQYFTEFSY